MLPIGLTNKLKADYKNINREKSRNLDRIFSRNETIFVGTNINSIFEGMPKRCKFLRKKLELHFCTYVKKQYYKIKVKQSKKTEIILIIYQLIWCFLLFLRRDHITLSVCSSVYMYARHTYYLTECPLLAPRSTGLNQI